MRPTSVTQAGMPGPVTYAGWWGALKGPKQKGIVQYSVSPYKQRPFAGVFQGYIFNGFKRIAHQLPYAIIPISLAYATYTYGSTKYAYFNSKIGHHEMAQHEGGH